MTRIGARAAAIRPMTRAVPGGVAPSLRRLESQGHPRLSGAKLLAKNPWPLVPTEVPSLNERYTRPESRARTVAVLGASASKEATRPYEPWAAALARRVVSAGGNVVSGCGSKGIMGAAFAAARDAAALPGSGENLTIIRTPLWGDEDLVGGRAIGVAASEEKRLEKFLRVAHEVYVFPGASGTFLEIAKLVFAMAYPTRGAPPPDKVVLVGDYWEALRQQLLTMRDTGQLAAAALERVAFVTTEEQLLAQLPSTDVR